MPVWLSVLIGLATLASMALSAFVAWMYQKSRGDFATFEIKILAAIDAKLSKYIDEDHFSVYSESHAKEHVTILTEIGALRPLKHEIPTEIRGLGIKIENLKDNLTDVKSAIIDLRDIMSGKVDKQ